MGGRGKGVRERKKGKEGGRAGGRGVGSKRAAFTALGEGEGESS